MDPGEAFLTDLIAGQHVQHVPAQNEDGSHNDVVDEDACLFSVASADEELAATWLLTEELKIFSCNFSYLLREKSVCDM